MKILLCTPQPISHYLGISRVLIDLKVELVKLGHDVHIIGPIEVGLKNTDFASMEFRALYTKALKDYLIAHSIDYDVVEYDHEFLPFDRSTFPSKPLFVARTVLLVQHTEFIKPKKPWSLRSFVGSFLRYFQFKKRLSDSWKTVLNADLINVPNHHDKKQLIELGIPSNKVCVIPFGLSADRLEHFNETSSKAPFEHKICFLGSFDYRKGASHFGPVFREIRRQLGDVKLLLLGCGGMLQDRDDILKFFAEEDHAAIETVFKFEREKVGEYLKHCSLGIYPSYMEGFPFGILEMLTAYLPVIAFDAPGASMMLGTDDLVDVGDEAALIKWVVNLLSDNALLESKRLQAHQSSIEFTWQMVAEKTLENYKR